MLKSLRCGGARLVSVLLVLSLAFSPLSVSLAQVAAPVDGLSADTEAPVLIHRQLDAGTAGELQTFLARVSDDFGIGEVVLYFRQSDDGEFQSLNMRPLVDSIGEYMIAVSTTETDYSGLQYYIEAIDIEGNKTNRGFDYAPIILPLNRAVPVPIIVQEPVPIPQQAPVVQAPEADTAPPSGGFSLKPTTILLGVGAVLALGALVASGGGGSDDDTPSTENPDTTPSGSDTITLTVISDQPTGQ